MTRRTHEQALAYRRYPKMRWLSGTGEWLVLYRCQQPWRYRLVADQFEAFCAAGRSCGPNCKGPANHRHWRLIERAPAPKPDVAAGTLR